MSVLGKHPVYLYNACIRQYNENAKIKTKPKLELIDVSLQDSVHGHKINSRSL